MSTIVFVGQTLSDRHLIKQTKYKYHPDSATKELILKDLEKHLDGPIPEKYIVELEIQITIKEYDTKNT